MGICTKPSKTCIQTHLVVFQTCIEYRRQTHHRQASCLRWLKQVEAPKTFFLCAHGLRFAFVRVVKESHRLHVYNIVDTQGSENEPQHVSCLHVFSHV